MATTPPVYVQGELGFTGTASSISFAFDVPVTRGNTIIVAAQVFANPAALSVTDSLGSTYHLDSGATDVAGGFNSGVFSAIAVRGGPCTVTIKSSVPGFFKCFIHEYLGILVAAPVDASASATDGQNAAGGGAGGGGGGGGGGTGGGGATPSLGPMMKALIGTKVMTGVTLNHFESPGRFMSQFLTVGGPTQTPQAQPNHARNAAGFPNTPPSALNCSIQNVVAGVKTNSGQCPAIFGVNLNTQGTSGSSIPVSEELARVDEHHSKGGVTHFTWMTPSPTTGSFSGNGSEYPDVLDSTKAAYRTFMFGAGRTSANPNGGVWAMAQALLQQQGAANARTVMMRHAHEINLGAGSNWWGLGNASSGTTQAIGASRVVALQKQIRLYCASLGVTNVLWVFNCNYFSPVPNLCDPGPYHPTNNPGGRDVVSIDIYSGTKQSDIISLMQSSSSGVQYCASCVDADGTPTPFILSECGPNTFNNSDSTMDYYSWDDSIFNGVLQKTIKNLVGIIHWNQNWHPSVQNNWTNIASNGIIRGAVPAFT